MDVNQKTRERSEGINGLRYNRIQPAMKTAIIRLDPHDDAISTRDHMAWHKAQRVLLVWPVRSQMDSNRLDLTLIYRHAQNLGVELAVVAYRGRIKEYARELGIPVFRTIRAAQRSDWRKRRPSRRSLRWFFWKDRPDVAALKKGLEADDHPEMNGKMRAAVFTLGVLAVIALLIFFLPGATVTFSPAAETQHLTLSLRADPTLTTPTLSGGLPARSLTVVVEGQEQGQATGWSYTPLETARGTVVFTNLIDRQVTIPAGTIVRTQGDSPVRFETTRAGNLRGEPGATLSLTVKAQQPGKGGNVSSGSIMVVEGAVGSSVSATNPRAITGGADRSARAPSEADYRQLQEKLLDSLEATALREIETLLGPYDRLVPETLRAIAVRDVIRDPEVGAVGERTSLRMQVEFEVWAVSVPHIEAIASAALHSQLPAGYQIVPDSFEIIRIIPGEAISSGVPLIVDVERRIYPGWSEAALVQSVLGSRVADVGQRLNKALPLDGDPVVQVSPSWWKRLPFLAFRIDLEAR